MKLENYEKQENQIKSIILQTVNDYIDFTELYSSIVENLTGKPGEKSSEQIEMIKAVALEVTLEVRVKALNFDK